MWRLIIFFLLSCRHEKPAVIYMPDMVDSPAKTAQSWHMLLPPEHTIPQNIARYPYVNNPDGAGRELHNPLIKTKHVLLHGQKVFRSYCMPCHGLSAEGDGSIIPKFPRPPSLLSDKVRKWPDGNIFHVITNGQNLMPSYAAQISVLDRWAVIHYVRAIQVSKTPSEQDLYRFKKEIGQ